MQERQKWVEENKSLRLNALSNREEYSQFPTAAKQIRKIEASSNLMLDNMASYIDPKLKIGKSLNHLKTRYPRYEQPPRKLKPI